MKLRITMALLLLVSVKLMGQGFMFDTIYPMEKMGSEWINKRTDEQLLIEQHPLDEIINAIDNSDTLFLYSYEVNGRYLKKITVIGYKEKDDWIVTRLETLFMPRNEFDITSEGVWLWLQYTPTIIQPNWETPIEVFFHKAYNDVMAPEVSNRYAGSLPYNTDVFISYGCHKIYQTYNCGPNLMYRDHKAIYQLFSYLAVESLKSDEYRYIYSTFGKGK